MVNPPTLYPRKFGPQLTLRWRLCISAGLLAGTVVVPWCLQSREQEAGRRLLESQQQDLRHAGHSILEAASQALLEEDVAAANQTLEKLREERQVLAAALVDGSRELLAVYDREGQRPARVPRTLDPAAPYPAALQIQVLLADGSLGSIWLVPDPASTTALATSTSPYRQIGTLFLLTLILAAVWWPARSRGPAALVDTPNGDPGRECRQPPIRHARSIRSGPKPPPPAPQAPMVERPLKLAPQNTVTKTILIAEDHVLNRRVTAALMEREGYSCKIAEDGERALQVLEEGGIDLILMDCQMPVLDGFGATRRIREQEKHSSYHVPIIAMTASMNQEDRRRCLEAGMDDFIAKPMSSTDLTRITAAWLEGSHEAREQSA